MMGNSNFSSLFSLKSILLASLLLVWAKSSSALDSARSGQQRQFPTPPTLHLPDSLTEFYELAGLDKTRRHPGYSAASASARIGRSHKRVYIFLFGGTKSGKSEFVESLYSSGNGSTSRNITELLFSVPLFDLGLPNTDLCFIDVPEFGTSPQSYLNSDILVGLDLYLRNHTELSSRKPNLNLIFTQFDPMTKSLTPRNGFLGFLEHFPVFSRDLFDPSWNNVVFLGTEGREEKHQQHQVPREGSNTSELSSSFRSCLEGHIDLKRARTFIQPQGRIQLQDSTDSPGAPLVQLLTSSNRDLGLFLTKSLNIQNDALGEAVTRTFFNPQETWNTTSVSQVYMPDYEHSLYSEYLQNVTSLPSGSESRSGQVSGGQGSENEEAPEDFENSEISHLLDDRFSFLSLRDKREHRRDLVSIKRILERNEIWTMDQLPSALEDRVKLFRQLPLNEFVVEVLESSLELEIPRLSSSAGLVANRNQEENLDQGSESPGLLIGSGFNLLTGKVATSDSPGVYDLNKDPEDQNQATLLGFTIPSGLGIRLLNERHKILRTYANLTELLRERVRKFNVVLQANTGVTPLQLHLPAGVNIEENQNKTRNLTAVTEIRKFQLTFLQDHEPRISSEFRTAVQNLPTYSRNNKESVEAWTEFVSSWGTHVVTTVYGGGWIQIQVDRDTKNLVSMSTQNGKRGRLPSRKRTKSSTAFLDAISSLENAQGLVSRLLDHKPSLVLNTSTPFTLKGVGGDPELKLESTQISSSLLQKWEKSVDVAPTLWIPRQEDSSTLLNLAEVIHRISSSAALDARRAFADYFRGHLQFVPVTTTTTTSTTVPPPSKEEILIHSLATNMTAGFVQVAGHMDAQTTGFTNLTQLLLELLGEQRRNLTQEIWGLVTKSIEQNLEHHQKLSDHTANLGQLLQNQSTSQSEERRQFQQLLDEQGKSRAADFETLFTALLTQGSNSSASIDRVLNHTRQITDHLHDQSAAQAREMDGLYEVLKKVVDEHSSDFGAVLEALVKEREGSRAEIDRVLSATKTLVQSMEKERMRFGNDSDFAHSLLRTEIAAHRHHIARVIEAVENLSAAHRAELALAADQTQALARKMEVQDDKHSNETHSLLNLIAYQHMTHAQALSEHLDSFNSAVNLSATVVSSMDAQLEHHVKDRTALRQILLTELAQGHNSTTELVHLIKNQLKLHQGDVASMRNRTADLIANMAIQNRVHINNTKFIQQHMAAEAQRVRSHSENLVSTLNRTMIESNRDLRGAVDAMQLVNAQMSDQSAKHANRTLEFVKTMGKERDAFNSEMSKSVDRLQDVVKDNREDRERYDAMIANMVNTTNKFNQLMVDKNKDQVASFQEYSLRLTNNILGADGGRGSGGGGGRNRNRFE